ncbi:tigger transposable element-derived protein 6 [Elysia marginata]|uniref:Tigger transposable element-derived protein 6 n=1 Tax=Elysia marginata TaxID=1093978 RepID=A0AAV4IFQ8_9GAST|nr:tigger transposable element-derived protein 6 [Elysia marginata]
MTVLDPALEAELSESIQLLANWGFGFTRQKIRELGGNFVQEKEPEIFNGGCPGEDWMHDFEARHPNLSHRKPEKLKKTRVKAITNKGIFEDFLKLFRQVCEANGILNDSSSIFNVDETG